MNEYTLYDVVSSVLEQKKMTMKELAIKLDISELQLARELGKNKKINKEFLMIMFSVLDVSLIDNTTGEKIVIHTLEDSLCNALNKIKI